MRLRDLVREHGTHCWISVSKLLGVNLPGVNHFFDGLRTACLCLILSGPVLISTGSTDQPHAATLLPALPASTQYHTAQLVCATALSFIFGQS